VLGKLDLAPSESKIRCPFAGSAGAPEPLGWRAGEFRQAATKFPHSSDVVGSRGNFVGAALSRRELC